MSKIVKYLLVFVLVVLTALVSSDTGIRYSSQSMKITLIVSGNVAAKVPSVVSLNEAVPLEINVRGGSGSYKLTHSSEGYIVLVSNDSGIHHALHAGQESTFFQREGTTIAVQSNGIVGTGVVTLVVSAE
ncbi:MAG: hypothetical protein QS721_03415 [Candidatus Endonucleobacter sp. (ex Gigantidas childressi)]|nr:hypothetical protein [Candidatus Endonucleobacter sp. (ex Gigantidas childressi)]